MVLRVAKADLQYRSGLKLPRVSDARHLRIIVCNGPSIRLLISALSQAEYLRLKDCCPWFRKMLKEFHDMFLAGVTPLAEYGPKCRSCSMLEICMPEKMSGKRSHYRRFLFTQQEVSE